MLKNKLVIATTLVLAFSAACVKRKNDVNKVAPDAYIAKSELENKTYSFSKTVSGANEELDARGVIPGFHSDMGFVRFVVTEKELQVRRVDEVNRDEESASVVAAFPIEKHFDIQRSKNDFGEETNQIEENTEKPWNQRAYMRVGWGQNSIKSTSLNKIFGAEVVEEDSTVVSELQKEMGLISYNIDATVQFDPNADTKGNGDEYDGGYGALRAQIKYAFMEVRPSDFSKVAKREMPNDEFKRFGYFRTFENFINPDKGITVSGKKHWANKFNVCENNAKTKGLSCATNKIVYVVNKGFDDEFLPLAKESVRQWNETFKKALDRKDDVVVFDDSVRPEIGDPRYNMIAGINERVPTGLLGVSQTINNPHTGETLSARASVYMGTVKLLGGIAAEQLDIIEKEDGIMAAPASLAGSSAPRVKMSAPVTGMQLNKQKKVVRGLKAQAVTKSVRGGVRALRTMQATLPRSSLQMSEKKIAALKSMPSLFSPSDIAWTRGGASKGQSALARNLNQLAGLFDSHNHMETEKQNLAHDAENGIHYAENVESAIQNYIAKFRAANPNLSGDELRDALKKHVRKLVFYQTLLHEMGHNFGLRHNFGSSADRKNYTDEFWKLEKQIQETKLDPSMTPGDKAALTSQLKMEQGGWDYTSVMDYTDEFYELQGGPGKYDVAAVRFGYNGSIDTKADPITGVVRDLKFCTDHQVLEDVLCQRFDKGATYNEIIAKLAERYHVNYALRNFRRDRVSFGSIGGYMNAIIGRFMLPIRQAVDEFIYQLVFSPSNPGGQGACQFGNIARSIEVGEMANFCDPQVVQDYADKGLTLSSDGDLGIFLRNPDTFEFLKDPSEYEPLGFADTLLASDEATNFFVGVLGTPEPGDFIAMPDQSAYKLVSLPKVSNDETQNIEQFKQANGVDEDTEDLRARIVSLRAGPQAKGYMSTVDRNNFDQIERIGFIHDKIAAILMMTYTGLPILKYEEAQLNLNLYSAFQSKATTLGVFNALSNSEQYFTLQPVKLRSGEVVAASAPAAESIDTQVIPVIYSLLDFVRMEDQSFVDKMRICNDGDARCKDGLGIGAVSMVSISGQEEFKAVQVPDGDSLAVTLISRGSDASKSRVQAVNDLIHKADVLNLLKDEAVTKSADKKKSRKDWEDLIKKAAPKAQKTLDTYLGEGSRKNQPTLWQLIMDEGAKGESADPDLAIQIQGLMGELSPQIEMFIMLSVTGPDAENVLTSTQKVLAEMKAVNDLTVRSVASSQIYQTSTDALTTIDRQARVVRDIMSRLGLQ